MGLNPIVDGKRNDFCIEGNRHCDDEPSSCCYFDGKLCTCPEGIVKNKNNQNKE